MGRVRSGPKTSLAGTYLPNTAGAISADPYGQGSVDRGRSSGAARIRYEDGTEVVENGTTWNGWTNWGSTLYSQSGGLLLSDWDSGEGSGVLTKPFAVAATDTFRVISKVVVPATAVATNAALYSMIGITASALATPLYTDILGAGVGEKHLPMIWNAISIGSAGAEVSGAPVLAAGTYYLEITGDLNRISFSITTADGTLIYRDQCARSVMPTITKLVAVQRDSRKTTGVAIGPVAAKTAASTMRAPATVLAEGGAVRVNWTRPTARTDILNNLFIMEPPTLDARKPTPVIYWCHGSGRTASDPGNSNTFDLLKGLAAAGFLVVCGDQRVTVSNANNWGADEALHAAVQDYRYVRDRYSIGPVLLYAASMGALVGLNILARRTINGEPGIPGIQGFYGFYPVTNLAAQYAASHTTPIRTAYGFSTDGQYAAATVDHDPNLRSGWEFRGMPMRFSASYGDTVVSQADNTDLFRAKVAAYAPESGLLQATGEHGDPTQTVLADAIAFANRCLALT